MRRIALYLIGITSFIGADTAFANTVVSETLIPCDPLNMIYQRNKLEQIGKRDMKVCFQLSGYTHLQMMSELARQKNEVDQKKDRINQLF